MALYNSYITSIQDILHKRNSYQNLEKSFSNFTGIDNRGLTNESLSCLTPDTKPETLAELLGKKVPEVTFGDHPEFAHLKNGGKEYHYAVSMFIDIQGSTNLNKKYDLEQIHLIKNTVLNAAIQTCAIFDGHIQRLQGDGLFVYFVRKGLAKKEAIRGAVNAASFFSYFIKYELKKVFEQEGIENIKTRIGIDFGDDDKVLWAPYGFGKCQELTTTSLHTDLAAKLQSCASPNCIMVGDNIKSNVDLLEEYYKRKTEANSSTVDESMRYVFKDDINKFYYSQWEFQWMKYLKEFPFIGTDENGELVFQNNVYQKLKRLEETKKIINNGTAYTTSAGIITNTQGGVKNQPHRFYYEK
jgi:adenylate cyclase